MAPLPQENTQRWFYTYSNSLHEHTFEVRGNATATLANADSVVGNILSAIGDHFVASTITKVEHSAQGSNLRFAVASDRIGDTFGGGVASPEADSIPATWVGRSTGGRRTRFSIFGWNVASTSFRTTAAEDADVGAVATLLSTDANVFVGIDGQDATWYPYVNLKPNDHWVKVARS